MCPCSNQLQPHDEMAGVCPDLAAAEELVIAAQEGPVDRAYAADRDPAAGWDIWQDVGGEA